MDERDERALFTRRARAERAPRVPDLAAILARADAQPPAEPVHRARARGAATALVAALAVAASVSGLAVLPRGNAASRAIVADRGPGARSPRHDRDAGATALPATAGGEAEGATCSFDDRQAACTDDESRAPAPAPRLASLAPDRRACEETASRPVSTMPRSPLACEREETCSFVGP